MRKTTARQSARGKSAVFPLRIPAEQYEQIGTAADLSGDSVASFIRAAALKAAERKIAREAKRVA